MGDNITDLPTESGNPPVPPKTYQWEDIRRQKLEGRYPWTHLFKPPFDEETYEKTKNHEYEPVIPMDSRKTPPFVKVTVEENKSGLEEEHVQDKHHLCIPQNDDIEDDNDYEDEEDDDTEEITAAELQNRLEERYFRQSPDSSKHDYELPETRSVSPAITDDAEGASFQDKVHSQTDKIKQKFKTLKDRVSSVENSPRVKRKKDDGGKARPAKKNKFNFRKHAKLPDRSNFRMPQAPRFSFSSLSSFSRSRSNSVKERERKRSQSSESDSQKKRFDFHFSTYPRIFNKRKKRETEENRTPKVAHKSAPSSPSPRRSPFPQRWISKFTDHKKEEEKKDEQKSEPKRQTVVQETIFISLHEDTASAPQPDVPQTPIETDGKPLSMKVDNKNFIFISLHEERFPEKLEKLQQEEESDDGEIKKVETARKFTNLLKRLETDRKLKSKRSGDRLADDKPEPVTITEITTDEEGDNNNSTLNLENSVETPEGSSDEIRPSSTEPPSYVEDNYETEKLSEPKRTPTPEPVIDQPKVSESPAPQSKSLKYIFAKMKTAESAPPAEPHKSTFVKAKTPESSASRAESPLPTFNKAKTSESTSRTESLKSIFIKAKTPESAASRAESPKSKFIKANTPESSKFRPESPKSIFTKAKTPEATRPESPKSLFATAKSPEAVRPESPKSLFTKTKTPEAVLPESIKSLFTKTKTPESSRPESPKSILIKTKTAESPTPQPKLLKSILTRAKTPDPPAPQTKSLKSIFTRAKTPDPTPTSPEPKESKFGKLKEILKDTEKLIKPTPSETKDKEPKDSKKFAEFKENLLKETEKIGTLKNKIKNYFAKETEPKNKESDDKHIYEEFDNVDEPSRQIAPQKAPRKKVKKLDSDDMSKESSSAFEDPILNDIITLDEQKPMTKTYIKASLEEVHDIPVELDDSIKRFKNYEKALEKSRSYSSIEIDNNQYSTNNTLARLEAPIPPSRPSRTRSLQRKRIKPTIDEDKENYDAQQNQNYNTFPLIKPDKPRRKFRKHRTYSNSTNQEVKSVNELEDATISQNIANSKQLSVSFLPLTSNIVGEPIPNYHLRETSSMIHLNLNTDPPLPPKRRKPSAKDDAGKYHSLPNPKYSSKTSSKTSLAASETCNGIHGDGEDFEYADDVNSTGASDTPPRRPSRKRSAAPSLFDEDRTSREIESLPSEKSLCDSDSKDINGYAVIKSAQKSHSQPTAASNTTPRRKSRRLSDFFTLPRIRPPTNYVSEASTFDYERRVSPSRPPRKSKPFVEPVYTNEENINVTDLDFGAEEELNFNLATVEDDIPETTEKDEKNLKADEVMERMKIRPLPPPPRPTRKPRDEKDGLCDYSQVKKNSDLTNNLNQDNEPKIINTEVEPVKEPEPEVERRTDVIVQNVEFKELTINKPSTSALNVITAEKLNVSELNVAKLSISEIESSKLVTSNVDSVTMQVSDIRSEAGSLIVNSVHLNSNSPIVDRLSPTLQESRSPVDYVDGAASTRDVTPSSEEAAIPETSARSRISSMIPEVGSDEESTSTVTKVVRPNRRKPVKREEPSKSSVSEPNQPTLSELMCQILQICHSSVGQAIHSLLEQIIPEDREKRNEVQAAIWVITIIVAGCLMLGLQTNEKIVHHHHWDFHFPPPH